MAKRLFYGALSGRGGASGPSFAGKPLSLRVVAAFCCLVVLTYVPSCFLRAKTPEKYDLRGVRLVVWDALQPKYPGAADYSEEVARVISGFCLETGVAVDLRYVERREVMDLLSGADAPGATEGPHLVFSGEWPVVSDGLADLSDVLDPAVFIDPAAAYWTVDGRFLGIPAFIQWTGVAVKRPESSWDAQDAREGDDLEEDALDAPPIPKPGRTAYWTGSPAFLRCALDGPEAAWDAGSVIRYAKWVKDSYGAHVPDPLLHWQLGEVDALYPVNPYLYKWLQTSQDDGPPIALVPPGTPFGDSRFHYTVPAYLVLCEGQPEKTAAALLGQRLAASLGRWAARTLGCIPALVDDMPIFNLESDFGYTERRRMWESVRDGVAVAPQVSEYLRTSSLANALTEPLETYLSGKSTSQSLEEHIRGAFSRHTRP
jgi:hypothetical protein